MILVLVNQSFPLLPSHPIAIMETAKPIKQSSDRSLGTCRRDKVWRQLYGGKSQLFPGVEQMTPGRSSI